MIMFCHTDDSTIPSSTLDSDTDSCSSQSFSSSNEHLDQSGLDFLSRSWPVSRDKTASLDDQFYDYTRRNDLKTVWRNSSNASTPRTRTEQTSVQGCSPDASALYNNTTKHYNPSVSGQHACQEMSDYREWANGYLQYSPHNTIITDLSRDLADGQTLLHLVEELLGFSVDPVHVKPALEVQKIENIQTCLDVLARHGIPVQDLPAEDIVEANPKLTLVLCKHLKQHFGYAAGSPQEPSNVVTISRRTPSSDYPRTTHRSKSPASRLPVMDNEDVSVLDWVGQMTGRVVSDYNSFQDGHTLCLLINKLTDGAVPDVVLEYGLPSEKVCLALMFSEEELGVTCDLSPDDVVNVNDTTKMSSFLKTLHRVFLGQIKEKEHDIILREIHQLARKPGELMAQEKVANIEFACEAETAPRKLGKNFQKELSNGEKDSFPSMAKDETKRRKISKERSFSGVRGFSSYLPDSTQQTPRDNRSSNNFTENTSHFFEDLPNKNNSYRKSPTSPHHPLNSIDVYLNKSRSKSSPCQKLVAVPCFDEELMHGLLSRKSSFDSGNWTHPYTMPHAPKSWQKERENAQHQISDFRNELQRLKEEYFRLMNTKVLQIPEQDSLTESVKVFPAEALISEEDGGLAHIDNKGCSSVERKASKCTIRSEEPVKEFGQTSSCVMAYMNVKKGTLPPYRTWSKYENTDGDRYRCYYSKKKTLHAQNNTKKTLSPEAAVRSHSEARSLKTPADDNSINLDNSSSASSQKKEMQGFKSCDKEDGPSGVISQRVSGRHLYGMTALIRLSSKKANAVSDTDS